MPQFPRPVYFGKRRHWSSHDVLNFERQLAGLSPLQPDPVNERWLTAAQIRERYNVSDMWLWRRTAGGERQRGEAAKAVDLAPVDPGLFGPGTAQSWGLRSFDKEYF